jgi:hypothetical protein
MSTLHMADINVSCGPKTAAQLAQERRQRKKAGK